MSKDNEIHLYKANAQGMRCQIKPKLVLLVLSLVTSMSVAFLRSLSNCLQVSSLFPIKLFNSAHMPKNQSCNKQHRMAFGLAMALVLLPQVRQILFFPQNAF